MARNLKTKSKKPKTRKNALKDIKRLKKNEEVIKRLREAKIVPFPGIQGDFSENIDKNENE